MPQTYQLYTEILFFILATNSEKQGNIADVGRYRKTLFKQFTTKKVDISDV